VLGQIGGRLVGIPLECERGDQGERLRLISAREATRRERASYEADAL
jgi:uncharacterized DUF497 family protein